ncbi:Arm DNA-binding domain-containing protein [Methylocystis sp.]|uniref:Arm DNA-binding domain-containing protein n=1 Tax=Methylocystis sp. TaxID=1911079 RepID=UPI003DA3A0A6
MDGGGLQLWITPEKKRYWRCAYRFDGKQKVFTIGVYHDVVRSAGGSHGMK